MTAPRTTRDLDRLARKRLTECDPSDPSTWLDLTRPVDRRAYRLAGAR